MDRAVVLDAPGIDAARTQRSHQFPAGGPRDQELVALRPAPDDLDDVHEIGGIGELVPNLAVRADPAIVPEIAAVDLVRRRLAVPGAAAAQAHRLGENDVGGGIGGIEQPVQRRVEQIIADHDQARMLLRIRPMVGHDVARRHAAGQRIHRRQPAMDLAFKEMGARVAE